MTNTASRFYVCGLALTGVAVALGLFEPLAALLRFVPLDPNEGWNAFFGQIAVTGGVLYPPPGSFIVNNYPPLSFYIVGGIGKLYGDNIFAGRFVALASMTIVALNVFLWLRATGSDKRVAWLGAGIFAALAVTYARPYAAINDPQWLAHALMTTGVVILWRGNATTRAIAIGAALMLAGGWTKHILIPLPIAVTWWLLRRSRTALVTWVFWGAGLLAVTALLVWWMYGSVFFDSIRSARAYSVHQAVKETRRVAICFAPFIILSLLLVPRALRSEKLGFAVVYFLASAAVAMLASGGIGVDINAFFDLMIAVSLGAALAVDMFWQASVGVPGVPPGVGYGPVLTLVLGAYLGAYAVSLMPGALREHRHLDVLEQETRAATRLIAEHGNGQAACETPELCYWAKSAFTFDFFNYGQRLIVGVEPMSACAAVFDGRTLPLLQLDPNKGRGGSFQLPEACNDVIRQNYRPILTSSLGAVLAPADGHF